MDAVRILFGDPIGAVEPDPTAKFLIPSCFDSMKTMSDTGFLNHIVKYPTEEMTTEMVDLLVSYFKNPLYTFEAAESACGNVAGLQKSTIAMTKYFAVNKDVIPVKYKMAIQRRFINSKCIVTKASRYPLIIDPQCQGKIWVTNMEKDAGLITTTLGDRFFRNHVEDCISYGKPLLIEDIGEELDTCLDNILVYSPEICARTSLIDFAVTMKGLEDQLIHSRKNRIGNKCGSKISDRWRFNDILLTWYIVCCAHKICKTSYTKAFLVNTLVNTCNL